MKRREKLERLLDRKVITFDPRKGGRFSVQSSQTLSSEERTVKRNKTRSLRAAAFNSGRKKTFN